jgi:hypothetical protein
MVLDIKEKTWNRPKFMQAKEGCEVKDKDNVEWEAFWKDFQKCQGKDITLPRDTQLFTAIETMAFASKRDFKGSAKKLKWDNLHQWHAERDLIVRIRFPIVTSTNVSGRLGLINIRLLPLQQAVTPAFIRTTICWGTVSRFACAHSFIDRRVKCCISCGATKCKLPDFRLFKDSQLASWISFDRTPHNQVVWQAFESTEGSKPLLDLLGRLENLKVTLMEQGCTYCMPPGRFQRRSCVNALEVAF